MLYPLSYEGLSGRLPAERPTHDQPGTRVAPLSCLLASETCECRDIWDTRFGGNPGVGPVALEGDGDFEGGMAGGRCPRSGHQYRPDVVGREGIAEFQGFPSGVSSVRLPMSAVWASGRSRGRVRGSCGGIERLGSGFPLLVPVQGPAGALVQCRLRHEFSAGRPGEPAYQ